MIINKELKRLLGFTKRDSDIEIENVLTERTMKIVKPCRLISECPYKMELIRKMPGASLTKTEMKDHVETIQIFLLNDELYLSNEENSVNRLESIDLLNYLPYDNYPDELSINEIKTRCECFNRLCPAFFYDDFDLKCKKKRNNERSKV